MVHDIALDGRDKRAGHVLLGGADRGAHRLKNRLFIIMLKLVFEIYSRGWRFGIRWIRERLHGGVPSNQVLSC